MGFLLSAQLDSFTMHGTRLDNSLLINSSELGEGYVAVVSSKGQEVHVRAEQLICAARHCSQPDIPTKES